MNQNQTISPSGKKRRWRYLVLRLIAIYLGIGLAISCAGNLWGATTGGVSAFVWTGSLKGNAILLFWWFIVPAITWPYDLYWALYHKVF
ncbi:MAG TPA: hypothetical protein VN825_00305 [Candidatus Acidoferrum sp.]|nr:hypothetical protein [Candidatus Acidoferrum sp.]